MAKSGTDLDHALDELYGSSPAEFTPKRDSLAKSLRASGDSASAAQVKAQRKPTQIAYVLNQLARRHADDVAELVDVGRDLARAQRKALRGEPGTDLRDAIGRQRTVVAALTAKSATLMKDLGISPAGHLDEIAGALRAALVDPAVGAQLEEGRLDKVPVPAASFPGAAVPADTEVIVPLHAEPKSKPEPKPKPKPEPKSEPKPKPKPKPKPDGTRREQLVARKRAEEEERRERARAKAEAKAEAAAAKVRAAVTAASREAAERTRVADQAEREADGHAAQAKKLADESEALTAEAKRLAAEAKRLAAEAKRVARNAKAAQRASDRAETEATRAATIAKRARAEADRASKRAVGYREARPARQARRAEA